MAKARASSFHFSATGYLLQLLGYFQPNNTQLKGESNTMTIRRILSSAFCLAIFMASSVMVAYAHDHHANDGNYHDTDVQLRHDDIGEVSALVSEIRTLEADVSGDLLDPRFTTILEVKPESPHSPLTLPSVSIRGLLAGLMFNSGGVCSICGCNTSSYNAMPCGASCPSVHDCDNI